jgi:molybdopterin-binding protein
MEQLLTTHQAAGLLRLHAKSVQSLARRGKLPAVRVGRKWLFPRAALLAKLGGTARTAAPGLADLSSRNQLLGRVAAISLSGVMGEVRVQIGGNEVVSIITRASVKRLGLKVGDEVIAVIKATDIMIGRP